MSSDQNKLHFWLGFNCLFVYREAGFVVETAPVGGHLGLVTHPREIFPKLFQ